MADDKIVPFTAVDVDAAVSALANNAYLGEEGPLERDDLEEIVSIVLSNASARGRLLPPGGEVSDQFTVLEIDPEQRNGGMVIHWSLEDAEEWKARFKDDPGGYGGRPYRPGPFGIYRRQMHTWPDGSEHYTPWSPVVSDTSEAPNG